MLLTCTISSRLVSLQNSCNWCYQSTCSVSAYLRSGSVVCFDALAGRWQLPVLPLQEEAPSGQLRHWAGRGAREVCADARRLGSRSSSSGNSPGSEEWQSCLNSWCSQLRCTARGAGERWRRRDSAWPGMIMPLPHFPCATSVHWEGYFNFDSAPEHVVRALGALTTAASPAIRKTWMWGCTQVKSGCHNMPQPLC